MSSSRQKLRKFAAPLSWDGSEVYSDSCLSPVVRHFSDESLLHPASIIIMGESQNSRLFHYFSSTTRCGKIDPHTATIQVSIVGTHAGGLGQFPPARVPCALSTTMQRTTRFSKPLFFFFYHKRLISMLLTSSKI